MDHALQTISYTADIGSVLVLMARRRLARRPASQTRSRRLYKMLCHVFHSEDVSVGGYLGRTPPPGAPSVLPLVLGAVRPPPPQPLVPLWADP